MNDLLHQFKVDTPAKRWLQKQMDNPPEEWCCLIWPFNRARNGYGIAGDGAKIRPHRIMCEWRNGPAPSPKHQAAHSCGRGHDGCVNPFHLSWKTPSENQLDRFRVKPRAPARKLTPVQVDEIREMKGRERTVDTAARFGVTEANIRQIQSGKTWSMESRRHRFTDAEILRIRNAPPEEGMAQRFAQEFGVSRSTIYTIRKGKFYQHVCEAAE